MNYLEKLIDATEDLVRSRIKFRHQGRDPKTGLDCAGLFLVSHWRAGIALPDYTGYSDQGDPAAILRYFESNLVRIEDPIVDGDIVPSGAIGRCSMAGAGAKRHILISLPGGLAAHALKSRGVSQSATSTYLSRVQDWWVAPQILGVYL